MACSLSASPLPTPSWKRPWCRTPLLAAAWAMIAGWMRTVGQVTPVVTGSEGRKEPIRIRPCLALLGCGFPHLVERALLELSHPLGADAERACELTQGPLLSVEAEPAAHDHP